MALHRTELEREGGGGGGVGVRDKKNGEGMGGERETQNQCTDYWPKTIFNVQLYASIIKFKNDSCPLLHLFLKNVATDKYCNILTFGKTRVDKLGVLGLLSQDLLFDVAHVNGGDSALSMAQKVAL